MLVLVAALWAASPVQAQAKYFLNGERVGAVGGFLQSSDGTAGWGLAGEALLSRRVGLSLAFGRVTAETRQGVFGGVDDLAVDTWNSGLIILAGRQGMDGPLTVGLSLSGGPVRVSGTDTDGDRRSDGAFQFSLGLQAARVVSPPDSPMDVAPELAAAASWVLDDGDLENAIALGAGLGLGLNVSPAALVAIEPGVNLTFASGDTALGFIGTVSVNFVY